MSPEILLVREGVGYRVLHGHLHLVQIMSRFKEALVVASGEGKVKVIKTSDGMFVDEENQRFPLLAS